MEQYEKQAHSEEDGNKAPLENVKTYIKILMTELDEILIKNLLEYREQRIDVGL